MADKIPALQMYVGDWLKDVELRSCSLAARGLWWELLLRMHESPRRGYLEISGKPVGHPMISRLVGCSPNEAKKLMKELGDANVYSIEKGVVFSRRMVRDEAIRAARAAGGALGAEHGYKGAEGGVKGGRPAATKPPSEGGVEGGLVGGNKPPLKPPPSLLFSSSSSSGEEGSSSKIHDGPSPAVVVGAKAPRHPPATGAIAEFSEVYRDRYAIEPTIRTPDAVRLCEVRKRLGPEKFLAVCKAYVALTEPFLCENAHAARFLESKLDVILAGMNGTLRTPKVIAEDGRAKERREAAELAAIQKRSREESIALAMEQHEANVKRREAAGKGTT